MRKTANNFGKWPKKGKSKVVIFQSASASSQFGNAAAINQADASIFNIKVKRLPNGPL
ncbi:hypothetical protein [Brevibacillus borstelensis]|uniref:hypothetical protein n=1 Tax=Brevibacillus borstelensis TaxID=45462 RepID=UPI0030C2C29F